MGKKIVITSGGTGGHVFPALALAQEFKDKYPKVECHFLGGNLAANPFFINHAFSYQSIPCATLSLKNPSTIPLNFFKIAAGVKQSRQILKSIKPDVVIGFGSYYTLPVLLAAKWQKIPLILHEANSYPGKVNRLFSPYALYTGIHFPCSTKWLKGRIQEVGLPLRQGYSKNFHDRLEALTYFKLHPAKKTFLIFGGSQGARGINHIMQGALPLFSEDFKKQFQFIHILGRDAKGEEWKNLYAKLKMQATVVNFEVRMDLAWHAADYVVARAGANTVAELLEFEIPSLLIPYPAAADNHQDLNADFVEATVKAGYKCAEEGLNPEILKEKMHLLIQNGLNFSEALGSYKKKARPLSFLESILNAIKIG